MSSNTSAAAAASRRSSSSSSMATAAAKRPAVAEGGKAAPPGAAAAKKRVALGNITNVAAGAGGRVAAAAAGKVGNAKLNSATSAAPVKKGSLASGRNVSTNRASAVKSASTKPAPAISLHESSQSTVQKESVLPPKVPSIAPTVALAPVTVPCSSFVSPMHSGDSVSVDETMSTCDSMKSPDFEYIDNGDGSSVLASLQRRANENLHISEDVDVEETKWKKDAPSPMETDQICDVDNDYEDPQLCATLASDIYMHLREAETKKRPSTDFMETIQNDVNPSMRAILIDWLVEVAEEYRLVPDTLYLTVNYIDRYLSGNEINRQRLQLLGVACMLIAARFVRVAQVSSDEDPALHLEFLANYVAELSLLEYNLLSYPPSLVAASAIFLAKFILQPAKHPWALHRLYSVGPGSNLPAIREKYSQHKYKFVAKKSCPSSIPTEFFRDATC
uniref:Uncharacterized protein n=1 Tax=Leersia perrieri TaxID=77586 RepID=A0A0D9UYN7_9ORYZ